jgi:hypothetical protein
VQLAGARFQKFHKGPDGSPIRAGFFLGDGPGVGKGRQISGVILDSFIGGCQRKVHAAASTAQHL